ncbi:hypothetical protein N7539_005917 [Penicillium diatomitis]|uniref:Uncharacterized protein n=1 Tax=Penicillium diatomitis TaxID=2819901 RepID=A0A9X0BU41_9EURO|nr:uncharacterized protein N7539_005917 [Penicillium diatomitis]KAJ5484121.1 hypothetical protein N7539_005917 [Penicillium diatomitis]
MNFGFPVSIIRPAERSSEIVIMESSSRLSSSHHLFRRANSYSNSLPRSQHRCPLGRRKLTTDPRELESRARDILEPMDSGQPSRAVHGHPAHAVDAKGAPVQPSPRLHSATLEKPDDADDVTRRTRTVDPPKMLFDPRDPTPLRELTNYHDDDDDEDEDDDDGDVDDSKLLLQPKPQTRKEMDSNNGREEEKKKFYTSTLNKT